MLCSTIPGQVNGIMEETEVTNQNANVQYQAWVPYKFR